MKRRKRTVSIVVRAEDAERLKRLSPYSSLFVSTLIEEFFTRATVDEVWACMMGKPLTHEERVSSLRRFIREKMGLSHTGSPDETEVWERFKG